MQSRLAADREYFRRVIRDDEGEDVERTARGIWMALDIISAEILFIIARPKVGQVVLPDEYTSGPRGFTLTDFPPPPPPLVTRD